MRFQQMKSKGIKTLMLIYFYSVLSIKHFDRHFPPPSSCMEFKEKLIKSITNSLPFPLSQVMS